MLCNVQLNKRILINSVVWISFSLDVLFEDEFEILILLQNTTFNIFNIIL